jgi:hypothetical protein
MYYYSVSYKTIPSTVLPEIEKEVGEEYEMFFLFGYQNRLNDEQINYALESYLCDNKIIYTELIIIKRNEITEQEYIDRTQYT